MQIKLDNIGIIRDSTLKLDGLTVITGKNNSGKTTVGKTLYSMLEAVSDLKWKAKTDQNMYIEKQLGLVENALTEKFSYGSSDELKKALSSYPALYDILNDEVVDLLEDDLEDYTHKLAQELQSVDSALLRPFERIRPFFQYTFSDLLASSELPDFDTRRTTALAILDRMFSALESDRDLIDYARESINQTLRIEFSGQIQPVRTPGVTSSVTLSEDRAEGPVYFQFSVFNDSVVNDGTPVFWGAPFKRVYMIDDPFILDHPLGKTPSRNTARRELDAILNPTRIQSHNYRLQQVLRSSGTVNVFEQTLLDDSLKPVREQINHIVPGTFEFSSEGDYCVQHGTKIRISNLATGSKVFSIIKLLLEKGLLDSDTMLILDEPEAHLHPQWQNVFAEVIVLLVKELHVNVLLTTHSPNFMLALDACMRKYEINQQTNFYQTDVIEDGFVQYRCVNENIELIYDDFLQYLSEMKVLREQYLYDEEGDM
ncbi:MAG: AAA family ATPase [Oscillibacter sp.]|nr:AAA family ATPase [Oscillibacter sp.]